MEAHGADRSGLNDPWVRVGSMVAEGFIAVEGFVVAAGSTEEVSIAAGDTVSVVSASALPWIKNPALHPQWSTLACFQAAGVVGDPS